MNFSPVVNIAIRTARQAGAQVLRFFERRETLEIQFKGPQDPVTNADTTIERDIIQKLRKAYPDYAIIAEESGSPRTMTEWHWIIDPLDGTKNFIRGIPHFAISIALARGPDIMAAVIYNPILDELFAAERGHGAFLNTFRLRVAEQTLLNETMLATGFPMRTRPVLENYLRSLQTITLACGDIRRSGSAALDLAYTAAGRYDGFWEMNLGAWDIAAGCLLVQEAGGFVTDFDGGKNFLASGNVIAANPHIHRQMLSLIRPLPTDPA